MRLRTIFQFSTKKVLQEINNVKTRLQIKQTVADKRNLQQFLQTQVKDGRVVQTLNRTANYDGGFKDFLEDFKHRNQNLNITDMSSDSLNKTSEMREEELKILKEFAEKRKRGLFERRTTPAKAERLDLRDDSYTLFPPDEMDKKDVQQTRSGIQMEGDFHTLLIDRDTTTQDTGVYGKWKWSHWIWVQNGLIIEPPQNRKGKGGDFEQALTNALQDCKRNLIPIPLDIFHTCPLHLKAQFNNFQIEITPRPSGMNAYGHPTVAGMLMLAGMTHCGFKVIHRGTEPYAMVAAFFKAITQTLTPQDISERVGQKIYRQYWGKRLPREIMPQATEV